ncbi:MAG TPA: TolC family protein [Thermoanaerobaculia bacterium]|nr:TolC family protein [Thermoanaerobaculia bacterium]
MSKLRVVARVAAIAGIALGSVARTLPAAEPEALTLREAASIALGKSPHVAAARSGEAIASARASEARAAWLPQIQVSEGYARGNNPVFVFGSLLEQGRFGAANFDPAFLNAPPSLTNWRRSLSIRYPLFDQFRRVTAMQESRAARSEAVLASDAASQQLRLEVLRAYFGLQLARSRAGVAAEAVRSADAATRSIRDRFASGLVVESELLAAEVQLAEFRQQQIEAEGEAAVSAAVLDTLLRRPVVEQPGLATELQEKTFVEIDLDEALRRGSTSRPEIQSGRLASEIARLRLRTAHGSFLPRVEAYANWGASGERFSAHNSDHTVGLTISLDVLNPGRLARVAAARAGVESASAAERGAADQVSLEIVSAYHRFHAAREKLVVGRASVEQAGTTARIVHDRYEQGLTTITEDLRAATALVRARMALLASQYDSYIAYAELLRASGGLHDVEPFV